MTDTFCDCGTGRLTSIGLKLTLTKSSTNISYTQYTSTRNGSQYHTHT